MSHQNPVKNFGDVLTVNWAVRNDGGVSDLCRLEIVNPAAVDGLIARGLAVNVQPGQIVPLALSSAPLVNGTHGVVGVNACQVLIVRSSDASLVAGHPFNLTLNLPGLVATGPFQFRPFLVSGVITIEQGQTLSSDINCRNDGSVNAEATVITLVSLKGIFQGITRVLAPGEAALVRNWTPIPFVPGDYSGRAELLDFVTGRSVAGQDFAMRVVPATVSFLEVLSQTLIRLDVPFPGSFAFEWREIVRNNSSSQTGFYIARRTQQTNLDDREVILGESLRMVLPGQTVEHVSTTTTGANHVFGNMWVEQVDALGQFLRDLPPRVPYDVFL